MPSTSTDGPPKASETERTPSPKDRIGLLLSDRYRILELLGEGGMGAVYLAEHTHMRKRVALKLLHTEMGESAEVVARFEREAIVAAHVEHPNVAAATDFGRTASGDFFLVLEYVEGTSLRKLIEGGPLDPARALRITRQIALALECAHAAGVVHRDLKPENVMLVRRDDDPDFVKVLDFGIAKLSEAATEARGTSTQALTKHGTILGTPEYMSPEQALGESVGPGSDLYAIGVMLFEMLTGLHPFDPPDRMAMLSFHIVAPVPKLSDRAPNIVVPEGVEAVVHRLLEKNSAARYESARALIDAIDAHLENVQRTTRASNVVVHAPFDAAAAVSAPTMVAGTPKPDVDSFRFRHAPTSLADLRELVSKQPKWLFVVAAAALPIGAVVMILITLGLRHPTSGEVAHEDAGGIDLGALIKPSKASDDRVKEAAAQGPAALDALAKEYPRDARVLREAALAWHAQEHDAEAMQAIGNLAALDANAVTADTSLMDLVAKAASNAHGSNGTGFDAAFTLLEGPLGPAGVDTLIELSKSTTSRGARARAAKSLAKPDVREHASPAAAILLDFEAATKCSAKKDLLARVRTDGDARLTPALKTLKSTRGCGFVGLRDCWPCLRGDSSLEEASRAVDARSSSSDSKK